MPLSFVFRRVVVITSRPDLLGLVRPCYGLAETPSFAETAGRFSSFPGSDGNAAARRTLAHVQGLRSVCHTVLQHRKLAQSDRPTMDCPAAMARRRSGARKMIMSTLWCATAKSTDRGPLRGQERRFGPNRASPTLPSVSDIGQSIRSARRRSELREIAHIFAHFNSGPICG